MAQRYIYLNDELNHKLKNEENASGLISKLLNEHYATIVENTEGFLNNTGIEIKEKQIEIEQEMKILEEKQKEFEEMKLQQEEYDQKKLNKEEEFEISVKKIFREELNREMTEEEFANFKYTWANNETANIYEFIDRIKNGKQEL